MLNKIVWAVIYANFPLWVAVGFLGFMFHQWETVKLMLYGNVAVLILLILLTGKPSRGREHGRRI
jgi:hypothetical protein